VTPSSTTAPTTTTPSTTTTPPTTTTTTVAPPPPPVTPTLTVECATNPPHVEVRFNSPAGTASTWSVTHTNHPGETGLESIDTEVAAGTEIPEEPQIIVTSPNTLQLEVSVENESGEAYAAVGIARYSGCPTVGSVAARTVDAIDCVSGYFSFIPGEDSGITIDSVVVDRWVGSDAELLVRPTGLYRVPGWTGAEELKAVVAFRDATGRHEQHINHGCFNSPFPTGQDYEICADSELRMMYPADLTSNLDLYGSTNNSCSFFRVGPEDGRVDHHVTVEVLRDTTLAEAESSVLPPGPWTIAEQRTLPAGAYAEPVGPFTKAAERASYELAWSDAPDEIRRKVWLIESTSGGTTNVWRIEANLAGLDVIDAMAGSIQFVSQ